ncbi:MAG TPA: hypothetical protein VJ715_05380 [Pyrinomonadaceae bacterium]|nr:hypothetical protein [Pyrinomonadaceae bacterium]
MSNFLDNLASRSLKLVPVVQPRLASRFEPPTHAGRFPSFTSAEAGEAERNVEVEALNAWPEARPTETRIIESRRTVPISSPDAPREERPVREGQAAPQPQQSPPPRPAVARVPVLPIETRAQNAQTNTFAASPHAGPPEASFTERPQAQEAVANGAAKSVDEAALENRIRRLMAGRLNIREGEAATRGAPVAQPPAQQERGAEASPEKTQTIRVTIGRIDVRAVTAPAPQEPRRANARPAPQLSLADYLKQRGGGRR